MCSGVFLGNERQRFVPEYPREPGVYLFGANCVVDATSSPIEIRNDVGSICAHRDTGIERVGEVGGLIEA